jgi:magnesium-transporting ATPase (P-type)
MKTRFLLPAKYKLWGWLIFIPFSIFGLIALFQGIEFEFLSVELPFLFETDIVLNNGSTDTKTRSFTMQKENLTNEILGIMILIGCVLLTFSKEKDEDEFIAMKRLNSLLWATFVNSILLFLCLILFYSFSFLNVMIFNLYSVFVLFIFHFNIGLAREKRMVG